MHLVHGLDDSVPQGHLFGCHAHNRLALVGNHGKTSLIYGRLTWLRVRPWSFFHSRQPLAVRPSKAEAALLGLRKR